jgi:hypothetical protein
MAARTDRFRACGVAAGAIALLTVTVACGTTRAAPHSIDAMLGCLRDERLPVRADPAPPVAGSKGTLHVTYANHDVYVAFGKDDTEARGLADAEKNVASILGGASTETDGNVTYYAGGGDLSAADRADVGSCLAGKPRRTGQKVVRKFQYDFELVDAFVNSCIDSGERLSRCRCTVDYSRRRFAEGTFMTMTSHASSDRRYRAALDYCRSR